MKKLAFFSVYLLLIAAVLILFELALRIVHYGYDTSPFIKPKFMNEVYVDNYNFLNKYYSGYKDYGTLRRKNIFDSKKASYIKRGFIIGESTPQGYPFESNNGFGKIAETALNISSGSGSFEIINLSYTAMSSYYVYDAAVKALSYEPDFIIIYSGHNEYYGTVSASTGGGRFIKKLFIGLRELKIFQLIFSLLPSGSISDKNTLMASLSKKMRFAKNDPLDGAVALNYIRNLDDVVRLYRAKKIPVIVMEPVCNLFDMPPFSGEGDEAYSDFIVRYYKTFISGDKKRMAEIYSERQGHPEFDGNANIAYLDCRYRDVLGTNSILGGLINARDLDTVPFRARSALTGALGDYCAKSLKKYPNLYYIPLFEELTNRYGEKILGNSIFADHVHFNMKGQLAVGSILSAKIAEIFSLDREKRDRLGNLYKKGSVLLTDMYYTPLCELLAAGRVESLLGDQPYAGMLVPYHPDLSELSNNEILKDSSFFKPLVADSLSGSLNSDPLRLETAVLSFYRDKKDAVKLYKYLMSYFSLYPGSYWPYLYLARFYNAAGGGNKAAGRFYEMAYLLSDKDEGIYAEFASAFPYEAGILKNGNK